MDDSKIIEMLFAREEESLSEIEKKYGGTCLRIAENIVGNRQDAEECVSDAYFTIWNSIPPENPNPFSSFLYKILRNISLKKLRFNSAAKRNAKQEELGAELEEFLPAAETVESRVEQNELTAAINEFLETLTADNRKIFVMRYWFLESYEKIASETGISESNVSMRLVRTRNKMKKFLERKGIAI
jgi:RNA polymerase sigma-70 factor (ECF subfamily)